MKFSNEKKIILYCLQARLNKADHDRIIELCKHPIDWKYVVEKTLLNKVELILYYNLKKICKHHEFESGMIEPLNNAYLSNKAKNLYLGHELCKILKQFDKKHIEVIVLKGPALAHIIYPDFGMRKYGDIDILIKKEERHIVEKLMHDLGYFHKENYNKQKQYEDKHFHLAPYIHSKKNIYIEIHWNITNQFPLIIDNWWKRSRKEKILVSFARVLSPDDLIKHLCVHALNHSFLNIDLRNLCDISETIKYYRSEIDWINLQEQVEKYPISTEIYSILYYIKKNFLHNTNDLNWLTYNKADLKLVSLLDELIFRPVESRVWPDKIFLVFFANSLRDKVRVVVNKFFPRHGLMTKRFSLMSFTITICFYNLMRILMLPINKINYIGNIIIHKAKVILFRKFYLLRRIL